MSRIQNAFAGGKAFIAFVTAGDPDLETTARLLPAMERAGADLIEIGVPFSDPVAEGVVIQRANERALAAGATTDKLFELVAQARKSVTAPLVFLSYLNPIYTYGTERFMKRCRECGVDGLIVPDLPFEEKEEILPVCRAFGVELVSLVAPTSGERIERIAREAEGFVYCVSSMGVTGVRSEIKTDIGEIIRHVKAATDVPCAVGFGISTPAQAQKMAALADGAIVGSAIVKLVEKYGRDCIGPVADYVRSMKKAVREAETKPSGKGF